MTHPSDEDLIGHRLAEALRHLEEAGSLIPRDSKRWQFLQAARVCVEATRDETS